MPTQARWREYQDLERVLEVLDGNELIHVDRPIIRHVENLTGRPCECCGDLRATAAGGEMAHISLLVNPLRGTRRLRHLTPQAEWAAFDRLAAGAERVYLPLRAYDEQLEAILDRYHKVVSAFGGQRGGKTTILEQRTIDTWALLCGAGRRIWWVSYKKEKTQIGVRKLVTGEGGKPPAIPRVLVQSWPKNYQTQDQAIRIVDGATIDLKFGDPDNLVGDPAVEIEADEFCRIADPRVLETMLGRLADFGGQLVLASTPVEGHFAEEDIYNRSKSYVYFRRHSEEDTPDRYATVNLNGIKNPWVSTDEIKRSIAGKENDPKVRCEWFGEWVGSGPRCWRHFRDKPGAAGEAWHLRSGPWREVGGWGLVNVTPSIAAAFFAETHCELNQAAGLDVNLHPSHIVVCQVGCPPDLDQSNPKNHVLFALDEVVKHGTSREVAKHLAHNAGRYRGIPRLYENLAIACDPSAAHDNPPASHRTSMTHAWEFNDAGHDCRPAHRSEKGKPVNPSRFDVTSLLHMLMEDTVQFGEERWPRLVVHAERCPVLIHSLRVQETDAKGLPKKIPGKASDKLCGPTEALGYLAWALYSEIYTPAAEIVQW